MKKAILLLLFLITMLAAVSCTGNGKEENSGSGTSDSTPLSSGETTGDHGGGLPFPSTSDDTGDLWSHNY